MQRDLVAFGGDLSRKLRPSLHLLADQEEGCASLRVSEKFEYSRRALRMRAVVEREHDAVIAGRAVPHAQRRPNGRAYGSKAGSPVARDDDAGSEQQGLPNSGPLGTLGARTAAHLMCPVDAETPSALTRSAGVGSRGRA